MLASSGRGLIIYQAYGNLYAMIGRKAHLLEDKQIPIVGVFDEVFSTWMAFGGNTRDLGSFGEEMDKTTTLHQQLEKLVNVSRAKKLEKSHDPLALVAHTGSSSRNTSSYYVTHPTSMVDYEDEYQQDDVHTNSEDLLAYAMLLLARAINQKNFYSNK
ncbi:hypothetical protein Tco_0532816 [Tanacetum coccineum]